MGSNIKIDGWENLKKHKEYLNGASLRTRGFSGAYSKDQWLIFLADKVKEELNKITEERLNVYSNELPEFLKDNYARNHKISIDRRGVISVENYTTAYAKSKIGSYPNKRFDLAQAIEFGTGLYGDYINSDWEINVHGWENGWIADSYWAYGPKPNKKQKEEFFRKRYRMGYTRVRRIRSAEEQEWKERDLHFTRGLHPHGVYQKLKFEVERNIPKWYKEFLNRKI